MEEAGCGAVTGRAQILASIRKSLGATGAEADRRAVVTQRLAAHPRGVIPARGQLPPGERLELFQRMVEVAKATIAVLESQNDIPGAVSAYLRSKNLPQSIRKGADPRLADVPWTAERTLEVTEGPSDGAQLASVSHAMGAVAESGTLVLVSGADNPTTLNFLPDHHLVVVDEKDIAGDYETVWERVRERFGDGEMPRVVNWITGPSRSGDIEQTHLLGAHGPRSLHVLVVRST